MDENIDITSCCRLCLSTKLTFNIHTSKKYINSDLPPLDEIIKELTTIQIEKQKEVTNISNNICFSCNYLIIKLYSFRQQSIISNKKFQEAVKSWKKNQELSKYDQFENQSKNLIFADSLVSIYARCLVRAENKSSNNKHVHNSKNNQISTYTPDSNALSDSALSLAFNEHVFHQRSSNQHMHPCHPSVNTIIKENPNIILPDEVINYNYDCRVVVETFKQLFREALCPRPKISKDFDGNTLGDSATNLTGNLNNLSASLISLNSNSDISSEQLSEIKPKINSEKCSVCNRHFPNTLLLEDHVDFCHKMQNEAIVLTSQLNIPKKCKSYFLRSIKLIDNEERLRLQYKSVSKIVRVPKLLKNKKVATKSNNSITFKTLDITESDKLLQKLMSDTNSANASISDSRAELSDPTTSLFSYKNKPDVFNSTYTPTLGNSTKEFPLSRLSSVANSTDNLLNVQNYTNTSTENSTANILKEPVHISKQRITTNVNRSNVPDSTTVFDYEAHRQKMLKSSLHVRKETNENIAMSNIPGSSLLCQEYLPLNRTTINNDIALSNVSFTAHKEHAPIHPEPTVNKTYTPDEIIKPNFYVDNMTNATNDSNLKRKHNEMCSRINAKRPKITKSNSKRIFSDLQGCSNILEKLYAPKLDLEEILRKDLSDSDLNEIDTSIINSAVSAYLRKNPRYFNLLEQLVGIRDLPVVVNIMHSDYSNTFDFIKAKCPDNNSDTPLIEMSRINWNNTYVLKNYTPSNKNSKLVGKSWQKKQIFVPLSDWKEIANQSLKADSSSTDSSWKFTVDFERLIDTNAPDIPAMNTNSVTNNSGPLSNVSGQSVINTDETLPSQKKSQSKFVFKRFLKFSGEGGKKAPIKILPKPGLKMRIVNRNVLQPKPNVTNNVYQMKYTQDGCSSTDLDTNLGEQILRDGEIIEIEDDHDINNQNTCTTDSLIDSEPGALKIVSVMSLNDDYNSFIEKSKETIVNTNAETNVDGYLDSAPIEIQNVGSYGILNSEILSNASSIEINNFSEVESNSSTLNLCTNSTTENINAEIINFPEGESRSSTLDQDTNSGTENISTPENITSQQTVQQGNDTPVSKQSGISVLSPTRINLLLKKNELKV